MKYGYSLHFSFCKMMQTDYFCFLALLGFAATLSNGLNCWQCEKANGIAECQETGRIQMCKGSQDTCSTVVRRNSRKEIRVWKSCKQGTACRNAEEQNFKYYGSFPFQCNQDQDASTCACCCQTDLCNKNEACHTAAQLTNGGKCSAVSKHFENGKVECSDSNNVGSVCKFSCTSDEFSIQPSPEAATSRCLPNGKWSEPKQCCAKPCPPYIPMDYVVLVHAKDSDTWNFFINKFANSTFRNYKVGLDSMRFARYGFSGEIHHEHAITLNQTNDMNSESLFAAIQQQPFAKTADGKVNTGAMLNHILQALRGQQRDVKHHLDVVLVTSDTAADDDVLKPAQSLRDMGVLTFARFFRPTGTEPYNMTQLVEIAGDESRVKISNGNDPPAATATPFVQSYVCDDICRLY